MFGELLKSGFLDRIKESAIDTIREDRDNFKLVFQLIEDYCARHKVIISNKWVLTDGRDSLQALMDKSYKLYVAGPFKHANSLTNLLHEELTRKKIVKAQTLILKTAKEQEEFTITYDTRIIATVYKLQKHKTVESINIIKPTTVGKLLYMPAEIELIDVYHNLYCMSDYKDNLKYEEQLYSKVVERKEAGILGGANCKDLKKEFLESLKVTLVKDWLVKKKNTVLVGSWAYDWLLFRDNLCADVEKIQIISQYTAEQILSDLQRYIGELAKVTITMREQELHIPKDFRTNRYTYYISIHSERGTTDKPFLDLFNCAAFEAIPCYKLDGIYLANQWVVLRFLFIDLWIIRVVKNLGLLTEQILNKKIEHLWRLIIFFRSGDYPKEEFLEFIGVFRDYSIDKKLAALGGKFFQPYYPETSLAQFKKYRVV